MDSLKARVFALALPAIGLIVSGSAVDATATETNQNVAVADGFTAIGNHISIRSDSGVASMPGSLNFVQRMPAADVDQATRSPSSTESTIIKLPPVEPELPVVGDELPPVDTVTAFAPQAIAETASPRRLPAISSEVSSDTVVSRDTVASTKAVVERMAVPTATAKAPTASQATSQPVDTGKMVIDSTPPSPTTDSIGAGGALVSYDEPVIHIVRRELAPSMKQEFYNDQLAAFAKKAEAKTQAPRTAELVADARAKTKITRMPLRQPGTESAYIYPKTSTGSKFQSVVAKPVPQKPVAKKQPVTKPATVAAAPATTAAARVSSPAKKAHPNGWSPVDIRSVNINQPVSSEPEVFVTQATMADKAQAQHAVQLGFELIQRRAHYSARARFIQALRIVARSLDDQSFTTRHTSALRKALAAYEEAVDFYPTSAKPDEDVNLYMILGGHKTPVLAHADANRLTPRQCVREYMAYAEQEFTLALGNDGFASQALYGLGRLEASKETASSSAPQVRANRSLMLYQTAMLIDQRNYAAANELGVLLAKYGKYDNAIAALQHCVKFSPEPTAWTNLANIYRRVGNHNQARMADARAHRTMKPGTPFVANQPRVEWVKPDAFVAMNANSNMQVTRAAGGQAQPAVPQQIAVPAANKQASRKGLWPFGSKK